MTSQPFAWMILLVAVFFGARSAYAANILLLDDNYADEVEQFLEGAGHSVVRVNYWEWNGSNPTPEEFDVVFIILGVDYLHELGNDAASPGYSALISYVQAGGVLVTTEWLAYTMDSGNSLALDPVLPFDYSNYVSFNYAGSYRVLLRGHPLAAGLPEAWDTQTEGDGAACVDLKPGVTVVIERAPTYIEGACSDTHAVAYSSFGQGLSIFFNTDFGYEDGLTPTTEHLQILANIVALAESRGEPAGAVIPVPVLPLWAIVLLSSLLGLLGLRAAGKR